MKLKSISWQTRQHMWQKRNKFCFLLTFAYFEHSWKPHDFLSWVTIKSVKSWDWKPPKLSFILPGLFTNTALSEVKIHEAINYAEYRIYRYNEERAEENILRLVSGLFSACNVKHHKKRITEERPHALRRLSMNRQVFFSLSPLMWT